MVTMHPAIAKSPEAGEVRIDAIDDEGESYGPVTLPIDGGAAVHFNSEDLENGNAEKGLSGGVGPGEGAWRLQLSSELDIEVLSYVRTPDGFVTSTHDTVPSAGGRHRVPFFNPGSNAGQVSRLRLINPGEEAAEVSIVGVDDRGESPGSEVTTTIPAGGVAGHGAALPQLVGRHDYSGGTENCSIFLTLRARSRSASPPRARSSPPDTPSVPCDTAPRYESPRPSRRQKGPHWQSFAPPRQDRPAATVVYFCTAVPIRASASRITSSSVLHSPARTRPCQRLTAHLTVHGP